MPNRINRICLLCKHFISKEKKFSMSGEDKGTRSCLNCELFLDPVTGETLPCKEVRASTPPWMCGPDGQFWEELDCVADNWQFYFVKANAKRASEAMLSVNRAANAMEPPLHIMDSFPPLDDKERNDDDNN